MTSTTIMSHQVQWRWENRERDDVMLETLDKINSLNSNLICRIQLTTLRVAMKISNDDGGTHRFNPTLCAIDWCDGVVPVFMSRWLEKPYPKIALGLGAVTEGVYFFCPA
jgi:hypothetical protein